MTNNSILDGIINQYHCENVHNNYAHFFTTLYNKLATMIEFNNLPDSIDVDYLKMGIFLNGNVCITKFNNKLYACVGGRGGSPNEYYYPSVYTIANPVLGSKNVKLYDENKDGVVIYATSSDKLFINDNFKGGFYSLIAQTAQILADNIASINIAQINTRFTNIFTAPDSNTANSVNQIVKKIRNGAFELCVKNSLIDKIEQLPMATEHNSRTITELVELHQYILANFFHATGINSNYNLKRERLTQDEVGLNTACLKINIADFINNVKTGVDSVNKMFGCEIKVQLSKDWKLNLEQLNGGDDNANSAVVNVD